MSNAMQDDAANFGVVREEADMRLDSAAKSAASSAANAAALSMAGRTALVAGLGVSGKAAATVLRQAGARVISVDERNAAADIHDFAAIPWQELDMVVTSPGFPPSTPFLQEALRRKLPVYSEVEIAWLLRVPTASGKPAPWIGITGTNGKTSTTQMVSHICQAAGYDAPAVGNIGDPVSLAAIDPSHEVLCVELSSFQMHFTNSLQLDAACITNIADDHLDWHGGLQAYAADKSKVFQHAKRAIVYNADDAMVSDIASRALIASGCTRIGFTLHEPEAGCLGIAEGWIVDATGIATAQPRKLAQVSTFTHLREPNGRVYPHLLADALAALALAMGYGIDATVALEALRAFTPGGHRIQTVATWHTGQGAIEFVDDSKATNAHAARASLSSFPKQTVVWIAGGLAKGSRFDELIREQAPVMRAAVIIGKDQEPLLEAFRAHAPQVPLRVIDPHTPQDKVMQQAVEAAAQFAKPGDAVLLAPACASMDQFKSYADRGNQFAEQSQLWVREHER